MACFSVDSGTGLFASIVDLKSGKRCWEAQSLQDRTCCFCRGSCSDPWNALKTSTGLGCRYLYCGPLNQCWSAARFETVSWGSDLVTMSSKRPFAGLMSFRFGLKQKASVLIDHGLS